MLSRSLAWFFIVLAACPFTAPFAACDIAQATAGIHECAAASRGSAAVTASLARAQTVDDGGARDEQFKDDDDHLTGVDVATTSAIEFGRRAAVYQAPAIHQDQSARPLLVPLRL